MYKLDLPVDYKESAAIGRRRALEEERKSRIFNAKWRTIGVDLETVDQQVQDRKEQEEREHQRNEAFDSDAVRYDKIASLLDQRQAEERRLLNITENDFRRTHQKPEDKREWGLYDPDYLKKDKPARVHDDDPRCGISGMQKFEGEDLNSKARKRFQQEQLREWVDQQERMREQDKSDQEIANKLNDMKRKELDKRACDLQQAEMECRKAIDIATTDFNKALAQERAARDRLKQQQEQDDNATEISNHLFGDILTENPGQAKSLFGPNRVAVDRWKGMSPEQLDEIRIMQEKQRLEKERLRQEEEARQREWDRQRVNSDRMAVLLEREAERTRKALEKQQLDDNKRLAVEQKQTKDFLEKEVYTNPPTASYFMQFNTTSR